LQLHLGARAHRFGAQRIGTFVRVGRRCSQVNHAQRQCGEQNGQRQPPGQAAQRRLGCGSGKQVHQQRQCEPE